MIDLNWINTLNKPELMPPSYVFGIVWPILYFMMALSLAFFIRNGIKRSDSFALFFFVLQLVLNLSWTPIFFVQHKILFALWVILVMILVVLVTMILFYKKSKTAGLLLVPYFLWLLFAAYLNSEFVRLNVV